MENAKRWFNGLAEDTRRDLFNEIINLLYISNLSLKDESYKNLSTTLNKKWEDELSQKEKSFRDLVTRKDSELSILRATNAQGNDKILNAIGKLSNILTPSKLGKTGEVILIDRLKNMYPKSTVQDISNRKGGGDIHFEYNSVRYMIESKMHTDSSLEKDPRGTVGRFRKDALREKDSNNIDVAIFTSLRSQTIPGFGKFYQDVIPSKNGNLVIIYIANVLEIPERLECAIECGRIVYENLNSKNEEKSSIIYSMRQNLENIDKLISTRKERNKIIQQMEFLDHEDEKTLDNMKSLLKNVTKTTGETQVEDKIIDIYKHLTQQHGTITKKVLSQKCSELGISQRTIRDIGGMRYIRNKAVVLDKDSNKTIMM